MKGNKTELYGAATRLNREVAKLGPVLLGLDFQGVYIVNAVKKPAGTVRFEPNALVTGTDGSTAFLSFFKDKGGRDYLMVTNTSYSAKAEVKLTLGAEIELREVRKDEGSSSSAGSAAAAAATVGSAGQAAVSLIAGEGRLFEVGKAR